MHRRVDEEREELDLATVVRRSAIKYYLGCDE
jgi:hypothetical protein